MHRSTFATWLRPIHLNQMGGNLVGVLRQFGLPERMYPQLSVLSASIGAGIVLVITLLAALYPALKVRRLKPVEAMAAV